ncbi:MAG: DUF350 domain-containing protein [Acidobacteriota bacterium]
MSLDLEFLDSLISGLVYLVALFLVFLVGKWIYAALHPRVSLREELFEHDNNAFAFAMVGYYMGLVLAFGKLMLGPSRGLVADLIDIGLYGLLAIILLNISAWLNDKVVLRTFDNQKEILVDRNVGTGVIEAGNFIANGLIIGGAISGEGGGFVTALAFWALGQVVLILAGLVYERAVPYDLHAEIERDNVAVGVAFAGVLIAIGNVVRLGTSGDFYGWTENLTWFGGTVLVGLLLLPIVRWLSDLVLVPGAKFEDELTAQEVPNVGAGAIEAFSYVAASMLINWTF